MAKKNYNFSFEGAKIVDKKAFEKAVKKAIKKAKKV
jgi:hypothetical protein